MSFIFVIMKTPNRKNSVHISLRVTREFAAFIKARASSMGLSVNAYIQLLAGADKSQTPRLRRSGTPIEDRKALAAVLTAFGQTGLSANINQLAKLANSGSLPLTPETEAELVDAARYLRQIYHELLRALGKKPDDRP